MAGYLVCYELQHPAGFERVRGWLEGQGAVRLLESVWALSTEETALELRDGLKSVVGGDDAIAIVEVKPGSWWACENAESQGQDWLRRQILA
jgi:hypothetical protein